MGVQMRLLALDCAAKWMEELDRKQINMSKVKSDVAKLKNYFLNNWGMAIRRYEDAMDQIVCKKLRNSFWLSIKG